MVHRLRRAVHLRLDELLLFIFIVDFVFVTVRVGEYITTIIDPRASITEPNGLIPFVINCGGLRVDSLTELGNR